MAGPMEKDVEATRKGVFQTSRGATRRRVEAGTRSQGLLQGQSNQKRSQPGVECC